MEQKVLPAISNFKEYEQFLHSSLEIGIFLEMHISQMKHVASLAKLHRKKIIYHVDMIHGMRNDESATEFICHEFKPFGLISTKSGVIMKAKQKGVIAIQRVFLIDSLALERSCKLAEKIRPDYVEVLPGSMPWMIKEVKERLNTSILAGGLIRTEQEIIAALEAGASAITTSKSSLWKNKKSLMSESLS
ncbi:glycerol-3-phosphate responsive antiterminator [Alkalihalobacillus alcalophilus ATCC 27647 = CGMCC 1.3604]|uniref:Glycerol uptake operon antiterminator regulatory protein n=1 Tax=Alkalihalobacillus alcalophilus ATCC 27647 = CGMCC 1.3604 TaxID=1218173 RepID=A0A094YZR3_ALKAL|nr:glycerol-3-phosphate responsive antiterminator [Alkalihalobacillus alcalophilus]KGA99057.1 glycerol-3-phosphate responsive antiterminator GlpP [Alkalihalobacillus alcalophilus ATCC 27647 = CGMCC 1.3604]MED1560702.1 glycerol-3-phosphate responsive antiterminator [Alkalihalobacillus alcalophilus]THG89796.1 glycerol-3-phosphate responsive antiterminator [Alkalihalobacillus alcalophilus ATCC 27647 = CGMCC 1.3604]